MLEKTLTVRIKLKYELEEKPWLIQADSADLEDAILNISINAMHAMSSKGEFTIATKNTVLERRQASELGIEPGEYLELILSDTGTGMDEETLSHIFDPFYSTKGDLGTGLGLSQVYGFIQRSRGAVKAESAPGCGSSFHLFFPRIDGDDTEVSEEYQRDEEVFQGDESILLVDDEESLRALMEEFLRSAGYRVTTVEGGKQALSLLENDSFDLLVSDVVMPEMDGYQLAANVIQRYPGMKIQFISGYNESIDNSHIDRTLREQTIQKPFDRIEFLSGIREALDAGRP